MKMKKKIDGTEELQLQLQLQRKSVNVYTHSHMVSNHSLTHSITRSLDHSYGSRWRRLQ
jgi:hypothetical protein